MSVEREYILTKEKYTQHMWESSQFIYSLVYFSTWFYSEASLSQTDSRWGGRKIVIFLLILYYILYII